MTVTRADLLTRLTNPARASAETQNTVLLTSAACADMLEAKAEIEKLRADRDQYDSWAREIKVNIDAVRRENDELRAALKPFAEFGPNIDCCPQLMEPCRVARAMLAGARWCSLVSRMGVSRENS